VARSHLHAGRIEQRSARSDDRAKIEGFECGFNDAVPIVSLHPNGRELLTEFLWEAAVWDFVEEGGGDPGKAFQNKVHESVDPVTRSWLITVYCRVREAAPSSGETLSICKNEIKDLFQG
jgi:hypothetical protein